MRSSVYRRPKSVSIQVTLQGTGTVAGPPWSSELCAGGSCKVYYPAGRQVWLTADREAQLCRSAEVSAFGDDPKPELYGAVSVV